MVEAPETDTRAYFLLEDEIAVVRAIKSDFHKVAESIVGSAPAPLRSAHIGEPTSYGGRFPAWVFYRITSAGMSRISDAQEKMLAEEYICQILIVAPATTPGATTANSGRGHAEDLTGVGFSAWIKALSEAYDVHGRCSSISRVSTAAGSHSEFGQAMFMDEARNILWAQSADIRVIL